MEVNTQAISQTVLTLIPGEAQESATLARETSQRYATVDDEALMRELPILASALPRRIQVFLRAFALDEIGGSCTIRGHLMDGDRIGATPEHWKGRPRPNREFPEEILLLLHAAVLGEPFGWTTQQDGHLVHDVFPVNEYEHQLLGTGSKKALTLHTEDAFHPYRADYIILASLRNPDEVPVLVAEPDIAVLSEDDVTVLFEERFNVIPDSSHLPKNNSIGTEPDRLHFASVEKSINENRRVAVLFGARANPLLRFDATHMQAPDDDADAMRSFDAMHEVLKQNMLPCPLAAGDFVFLNNHRVVHGRGSFIPRYDGTDRWLKRVNVTHDLRKSRELRQSNNSRLIGSLSIS